MTQSSKECIPRMVVVIQFAKRIRFEGGLIGGHSTERCRKQANAFTRKGMPLAFKQIA